MMKPDPRLCARRGAGALSLPPPPPLPPWPCRLRLRKSLKNCSNGDPGGNMGISGPTPGPPFFAVMVWVDDTLTTAGSSLAARSAKLSGAERAAAGWARRKNGTAPLSNVGVTKAKDTPNRAVRATVERNRRMIDLPGELTAYGLEFTG